MARSEKYRTFRILRNSKLFSKTAVGDHFPSDCLCADHSQSPSSPKLSLVRFFEPNLWFGSEISPDPDRLIQRLQTLRLKPVANLSQTYEFRKKLVEYVMISLTTLISPLWVHTNVGGQSPIAKSNRSANVRACLSASFYAVVWPFRRR